MKLTDYCIHFLADRGIDRIFLVTGGAAAHIVDSIGQVRDQGRAIDYVCTQHEQTAAMAAEAYARIRGVPGVAVATSGPGAINLISGICCAWFDSIPTIMLCGQVNADETKSTSGVRQLGFQETEIVEMTRGITKFSCQISEPQQIRYILEKAYHEATTGRPGPVLIDIPLNVQHADINPEELPGFEPISTPQNNNIVDGQVAQVYELLAQAQRPVIIAGMGIKIARAQSRFRELLEWLNVPMVPSWSGIDIVHHDHGLFMGQYGVYGSRGANFCVQNADLILSIGSRLDTRQTGRDGQTFARAAKKIIIDIDEHELYKHRTIPHRVKPDVGICADAGAFIDAMRAGFAAHHNARDRTVWLQHCRDWKQRYPAVLPEWQEQKGTVNAYVFIRALSEELAHDDIIIPDQGGNLTWTMQAFHVKEGQTLFSTFAHSPMGYALPASIGAAFATGTTKQIICIDGDGGFQMNIQDLQTVAHHQLPIKMFILNNKGYGIIKQFQEIYFDARYEATGRGYSAPDFIKVAQAYGIPAMSIQTHENLHASIQTALHMSGPLLIDVSLDPAQKLIPKLIADKTAEGKYISKPLEDMAPFLTREEFIANMIIPPLEETEKIKSEEIN